MYREVYPGVGREEAYREEGGYPVQRYYSPLRKETLYVQRYYSPLKGRDPLCEEWCLPPREEETSSKTPLRTVTKEAETSRNDSYERCHDEANRASWPPNGDRSEDC